MSTVITDDKKVAKAMKALQGSLSAQATSRIAREWAFPSGDRALCETFALQTHLGEMLFAIPPRWDGRQAHLFKLGFEGGTLSPDAEINIPEGLNRRIAGSFVDTQDDTWLCHRGDFTAFRGRVPRNITHDYFTDWLQPVVDGDRTTNLITITSLKSPSIGNDIAEFVSKVKELKEEFRASDDNIPELTDQRSQWGDHEEYEGDKTRTPTGTSSTYSYLHGPLCNALKRQLKLLLGDHSSYKVGKNFNADVAILDRRSNKAVAIFEVKTSASMSAQLYTAFGQLAFYKHKHGTTVTKLYLVLPESEKEEFRSAEFFRSSSIGVIFGSEEQFVSIDKKHLKALLQSFLPSAAS